MELQKDLDIKLYAMDRKRVVAVFVAFCVFFGLSVFVGAIGPRVTQQYKMAASQERLNMRDNQTSFNWQIDHLDKLNQQIFFRATIFNARAAEEGIETKLKIRAVLDGSNDEVEWHALSLKHEEERDVKCNKGTKMCKNITLLHEPHIKYNFYRVKVKFLNAESFEWMEDVVFTWITINHKFTLFELWFRFFFLVVSFAAVFMFTFQLRDIPFRTWNLTQKWLAALLFALLLYNNPIFPLLILVDSWVPQFLDVVFFATFLSMLLLFWLCVFDGLRQEAVRRRDVDDVRVQATDSAREDRSFAYFYLPKIALIGILWLSTIITLTWEELHALDNPNYSTASEIPGFVFFQVGVIILLIGYAFWIIYAILRASSETTAYLRAELKFLSVLTFFVIAVTVVGVVVGIAGTVRNNAAEFLSFFSLFNLYIYVLAFVYSPASGRRGDIEGSYMMRQVDDEDEMEAPMGNIDNDGFNNDEFGNDDRVWGAMEEDDQAPQTAV